MEFQLGQVARAGHLVGDNLHSFLLLVDLFGCLAQLADRLVADVDGVVRFALDVDVSPFVVGGGGAVTGVFVDHGVDGLFPKFVILFYSVVVKHYSDRIFISLPHVLVGVGVVVHFQDVEIRVDGESGFAHAVVQLGFFQGARYSVVFEERGLLVDEFKRFLPLFLPLQDLHVQTDEFSVDVELGLLH